MQQRIAVKKFPEFALALEAKETLQIKNPDTTYQIRSHKDGFQLVRRFSVNKINSYEESHAKKRSGPTKRQKHRNIDEAFLSEVRKSSSRDNNGL